MEERTPKRNIGKAILRFFLRFLLLVLITVLVLGAVVLGAIYVTVRGESDAARNYFVHSVKETSAIGFLADIFLSPEEVDAIMNPPKVELEVETDVSLVAISQPEPQPDGPQADAWGYVDEDGDGLILVPIKGGSYTGYMLIVLDPSRVVLGCDPKSIGSRGYTVQQYVEREDAVAGINGGGFADEGGRGDGSMPDTLIVHEGVSYCGGVGVGTGFVGIDDQYILHVGFRSSADVEARHIQEGCGYGPVLVVNGQMMPEENLASGLNPRTAIGQRSDGAILMLVIEGRQPSRLGASYLDEAELMLRFGAVNACNMDGGSSTMMWYNGEYVNNSASVIGIRPLPTSWIVLKEGRNGNG
jgi:exopolysaccharide biosynthesis protein